MNIISVQIIFSQWNSFDDTDYKMSAFLFSLIVSRELSTTIIAAMHSIMLANDRIPDSRVHGANMGPIWGRKGPGGPHVGPMNIALCDISLSTLCCVVWKHWPHEMLVRCILSSVFLRWSLFPPLSCMQYMGCVLLTTSRCNAWDKVRHIVFQTLF